jgi:hypothetical protein
VICLHEVAGQARRVAVPLPAGASARDLVGGGSYGAGGDGALSIELGPYQVSWLRIAS